MRGLRGLRGMRGMPKSFLYFIILPIILLMFLIAVCVCINFGNKRNVGNVDDTEGYITKKTHLIEAGVNLQGPQTSVLMSG